MEKALGAANQASIAKKVFLQNMSHDIRTPMNAVLGFTDLAIQAGNDTAKIQDYLKKIRISGNHLLGIVNEVLEISRIESGQTKLEETVCSIIDIVNETDVIIREQALKKKQEFTIDIWKVRDLYIYCDKLRVKEILVNLLGNAVKYTPERRKDLPLHNPDCMGTGRIRQLRNPCKRQRLWYEPGISGENFCTI